MWLPIWIHGKRFFEDSSIFFTSRSYTRYHILCFSGGWKKVFRGQFDFFSCRDRICGITFRAFLEAGKRFFKDSSIFFTSRLYTRYHILCFPEGSSNGTTRYISQFGRWHIFFVSRMTIEKTTTIKWTRANKQDKMDSSWMKEESKTNIIKD